MAASPEEGASPRPPWERGHICHHQPLVPHPIQEFEGPSVVGRGGDGLWAASRRNRCWMPPPPLVPCHHMVPCLPPILFPSLLHCHQEGRGWEARSDVEGMNAGCCCHHRYLTTKQFPSSLLCHYATTLVADRQVLGKGEDRSKTKPCVKG